MCLTTQMSIHFSTFITEPGLIENFEKLTILIRIDSEKLRLLIIHLSPSSWMTHAKIIKKLVSHKKVPNDLHVF